MNEAIFLLQDIGQIIDMREQPFESEEFMQRSLCMIHLMRYLGCTIVNICLVVVQFDKGGVRVYCPQCGSDQNQDGNFCSNCGSNLHQASTIEMVTSEQNVSNKQKSSAKLVTIGVIILFLFGLWMLQSVIFHSQVQSVRLNPSNINVNKLGSGVTGYWMFISTIACWIAVIRSKRSVWKKLGLLVLYVVVMVVILTAAEVILAMLFVPLFGDFAQGVAPMLVGMAITGSQLNKAFGPKK